MTGPAPDRPWWEGVPFDFLIPPIIPTFPKRPQPYEGTPGRRVTRALQEFRERERNRAENAGASSLVRPDVSAVGRTPPEVHAPPVIRARNTDTEADRIAQQEADRLFAEAQKRKQLMRQIGPVGRTLYATGRTVAEIPDAVASLAGRDIRGVSEPLRRERELTEERLIKPGEGAPTGTEETVGGILGTLPAFEVGAGVTGPVTKALTRRLIQRGVGKLSSLGERTILRAGEGLVQRAAELGAGGGLQGTVSALSRDEPLPQALQSGVQAGFQSIDPRHPMTALLLAHGAAGGAVKGAGETLGYRGRVADVREARDMRQAGFGPVMPEESARLREQEARQVREERQAASAKPPSLEPEPRHPVTLPAGAPETLGGTEAEREARRPRRGEPGVLGSGPILGEDIPTLAAGGLGAAYGVAKGETPEDKLLGGLAGATIGSGIAASLRARRGLHSGPLIGGPEAGENAPFFSRLGRTLDALPESGASPQRLESLYRSGAFGKGEYDHVLAHQLEGREPQKNIPKADLKRMFDREALRLRDTELPTPPDPEVARQHKAVSELVRGHLNTMDEARRQTTQLLDQLPPAAKEWMHDRGVNDNIDEPSDVVGHVNDYNMLARYHGTRVRWKTPPGGNRAVVVTLKAPGKPPRVFRSRHRSYDAGDVLHRVDRTLARYVSEKTFTGDREGDVLVDAPPVDVPALQGQVDKLQHDYLAARDQYRVVYKEQERLLNELPGEQTHYSGYGAHGGQMEPGSYREWLVSLDRTANFDLPTGWQTRLREGGTYEVRGQGGDVIGTGDTRGSAIGNALQKAGKADLFRRYASGHWTGKKDPLFHIRADVRTAYNMQTGQAERVLFIREIQSDMFQAHGTGGRGMTDVRTGKVLSYPRGYTVAQVIKAPEAVARFKAEHDTPGAQFITFGDNGQLRLWERTKEGWAQGVEVEGGLMNDGWFAAMKTPERRTQGDVHTGRHYLEVWEEGLEEAALRKRTEQMVRETGVPSAPWRQTEDWTKLAVRRITQRAVSAGLKHIVWTPGSVNEWAREHGFKDFYDRVLPKAFESVGKELGVKLDFEPAPLTRKAGDFTLRVSEPDGLSAERVARAWQELTQVKPWVIQRSQTLQEAIQALDRLFSSQGGKYRPTRVGEDALPPGHATLDQLHEATLQLQGERGWSGSMPRIRRDIEELQEEIDNGDIDPIPSMHIGNLEDAFGDLPDVQPHKLQALLERAIGGGIPERTTGAQVHTAEAVRSPAVRQRELNKILRQRGISDQAKVVLLRLLGVEKVEKYTYGEQYHSVRLPEGIEGKVEAGMRMYGGIPFDPDWFKAVGLPATTAAIGAGIGAVTGPDDQPLTERLGRAAIGGVLGAVGGREISRAFKARTIGRTGAAAVQPVPPEAPAVEPAAARRLELVKPEAVPVPESEASPAGVAARPGGRPDVEPPVKPDDYVNFAKLDLDPTGRTRLEAEVERVVLDQGIHPKKVVPWAEVRRAADQLGVDIDAGAADVNKRISGAKLLSIRNILSANIAQQEKWAGELADATTPATRRSQLLRLSGVLDTQNRYLLEQFVRARSEAGRELNALKIVAKRSLDPAVWWAKARQLAGRDLTADELANVRRLVEERDRAGLVSYVAGLRHTTVGDQLLTLWKAGLLTNPKTHVVNVTSNTVMAALETAKDPVAAGADWLLSLATGQRTKGGLNRHLLSASIRGARRGIAEASETFKGRIVGEELERGTLPRETTIDLPGLSPGANALLDGYQKYVFRALGVQDRVFFNMALQRSLVEQANLAGRRMGLRGVQLRTYIEGIGRGEGALADQITAQGLKDAAVATFRDRTRLGNVAASFAREFPGGQIILPFQRTPGAVATRVIEYSPLGLGKGVIDAIKLATKGKDAPPELQRMVAEQLGRGATGSGLVYIGYWLAQHGFMTGAAPTIGTQERQQWRQERRPANALHVNGEWVEVGRLSPVGNLLSLGASLHDRLAAKNLDFLSPEGIAETGFAGLRTVADQPFVTGVTAFGEALMQPDRELQRFVQGTAASVVPAAVGAVARGTDVARAREYEPAGPLRGVAGAVMERIPGLRQQLPPQRDQFGKTIPSAGLINAMFNPAQATPDILRSDPLLKELHDANYAVPRLPRDKGEGAISYERRQRVYGTYTRAAIAELLNSGEYGTAQQLEQQIDEQARALVKDPRFAGHSVERIREALMAQAVSERGAHTRAELLQRQVARVRAQLRKALR